MRKEKSWFGFFFFWVLVNTVGWLAFSVSNFYVALSAVGLLIAWLQFLVLKRYFELDDLAWIWLSFLLYGAVYALLISESRIKNVGFIFVGMAIFFGLIGYLQRRSLRYCLRNDSFWLVASPLAGCTGLFAAIVAINLYSNPPHGMFEAVFGCVYGSITGIIILLADKLPMKKATTTPE